MKGKKIKVLDYDPKWSKQFESLKDILTEYLGKDIIEIEHIGSTSIPGVKAKPIIDVDIIIDGNCCDLEKLISKLDKLGYIHLGDMGISGREAFKRLNSTTPNLISNKKWFEHNLYVCEKGSVSLLNHLNLRNHLRETPKKAIEYSMLKEKLAEKFPYDIDAYVNGKTSFILKILNEKGMKTKDTELIKKQNNLDKD